MVEMLEVFESHLPIAPVIDKIFPGLLLSLYFAFHLSLTNKEGYLWVPADVEESEQTFTVPHLGLDNSEGLLNHLFPLLA